MSFPMEARAVQIQPPTAVRLAFRVALAARLAVRVVARGNLERSKVELPGQPALAARPRNKVASRVVEPAAA